MTAEIIPVRVNPVKPALSGDTRVCYAVFWAVAPVSGRILVGSWNIR